MKKYVCEVCGWVYDEEEGAPDMGIEPGTAFEDLHDDFGKYIGQVFKAIEHYDFERYGYVLANNVAPSFNLGADTRTGARIAIPVK